MHGNVYFSAKHVPADPQGSMSRVLADHYARPAIVPAMEWLPATAVRTPVLTEPERTGEGVALQWSDAAPPRLPCDLVRRLPRRGRCGGVDVEDATALIATVRAAGGCRAAIRRHRRRSRAVRYTYAVTALDRVWNETCAEPRAHGRR